MSKFEQKPGDIAVFINDKKDNPKRPDMTGTAILEDGTIMQVSLWARKTDSGMKYMSGKIKEKQEYSGDAPVAADEVLDDLF